MLLFFINTNHIKIVVGYYLDSSMFNVIKDIKNIKYQVNSTVIKLIYNKDKKELNGVVYYDSYNRKTLKFILNKLF